MHLPAGNQTGYVEEACPSAFAAFHQIAQNCLAFVAVQQLGRQIHQ
jgi:hypothetical protein